MKKLFFLFVAFIATTTLWAYDFQVDGLCYNVLPGKDNRVEVTFQYNTVANYSDLTNVTIPNEVTYDGVTYRVTKVGEEAFALATGLESIVMGDQVDTVCAYSFNACTSLGSVSIGAKLRYIDKNTFNNCVIKSVHWNAKDCDSGEWDDKEWSPFHPYRKIITSFTFGDSVQSIPRYLIHEMENLTTITIPKNVKYISSNFEGCTSITSVVWNAEYFDVDLYAYPTFDMIREQIVSFVFGDSVKRVGTHLCERMSNLQSITLPEGLEEIGWHAFDGCSKLTEVVIPAKIKEISVAAFANCSSLQTVVLPDSLEILGESAFENCVALASIEIPEGVQKLDNAAFSGCTNLSEINIPEKCNEIGFKLLYDTEIYHDEYNWERDMFVYDNCLLGVKETLSGKVSVPYGVRLLSDECFSSAEDNMSITIPNTVEVICESAFLYCYGLTSVSMTNSVKLLGSGAFYGCSSLTDVVLSDSIKEIGNSTFEYCKLLESIVIPDGVTTIGSYAFWDCESLSTVTIGKSVESISRSAFAGCDNLSTIYVRAVTPPDLEGSPISSSPMCFVPCGTKEVYMAHEGWSEIASSFEEFVVADVRNGACGKELTWQYDQGKMTIQGTGAITFNCLPWEMLIDSITSVEIGEGVTSIPARAFTDCKKLIKLTLPSTVDEIGGDAFAGCPRLYEIHCKAQIPPLAEESTFTNYNAKLYIPCESMDYYQADLVFSKFTNIECLNTAVEDVVVPNTDGRKFLQDGQLLIHYEGKTYNILGKSL